MTSVSNCFFVGFVPKSLPDDHISTMILLLVLIG
jgi:hypothetical protein